jgi:hypothetical protein
MRAVSGRACQLCVVEHVLDNPFSRRRRRGREETLTDQLFRSGAHFQTCAQTESPTGVVEGLSGVLNVTNQDTADDPQININQKTVPTFLTKMR